mmetsp:Transcript_17101/g.26653  ORF Transcript_17101/g.26653 Transcript_17101/m.26653 type:complete len:198 (-) Transcript_17101:219-812(-)|eukprot:CAMPEP_0202685714 /NCGR_PEP_ID=MMETSP1385-20130828/1546_1 /ASSEMBLY_ACC=CAM_ASM_000861 /TAXON_ID=933848 /ORGANISM="Elphidium margaritaceum" /LENGTH=197 /DNA_ID=CAMNT_0049340141 /DNA_START=81 /DNA_END=674 /DNA_ORIENTATION=+
MSAPEYKIVVLGGGGVGKSALTIRLVTDNFLDEYDPTIEDSYRKQVQIDGKPALLDILDTAGQEEFNSMQDQWIREGKGFLLVYSITSRQSLEEVSVLRDKILRTKDDDLQETVPIVIAANKCDLDNQRKVSTEEGMKLAQEWGQNSAFFETSARTKINNVECFYKVVQLIREIELRKSQQQNNKAKKKKGGVCTIL